MRGCGVGLGLVALLVVGCASTFETLGAGLDYEHAPLPGSQVELDLPYVSGDDADDDKHRIDLFLPEGEGWPTFIFVHGGGWTAGDRTQGLFGVQPIRNLGRFYAARGIGVAAMSYRLQPGVTWREQVDDVARSVAWVQREIERHGGDPDVFYLGGHSAGAWLAAWVGVSDEPLATHGGSRKNLCALVLVSGAGYDLLDEETYALGASRAYFADLFGRGAEGWARAASPARHVTRPVPRTLVIGAEGEPQKFHRQSDLMHEAMRARGGDSTRVTVPGQNHQRILVSMSLEGDPVSDATLAFLSETKCRAGQRASSDAS